MELTELAWQVLGSDRLADKISCPDALTDAHPRARPIPALPARPPRLRLDALIRGPAPKFPGPGELVRPEARGRALHFFANHELLAAELMAVCLLRFPGAPARFRMGVGRILIEEQRHLARYVLRMRALGVDFGDLSVGGPFWAALSSMPSPLTFTAGMGLCFEQANLDHAARFARLFSAAGDEESAALMRDVLEDEIGHVAHGAKWFDRFRPGGERFSEFAASLPAGLDPVRARGPTLEVEPRLRAGLDRTFIDALAAHRAPKGRRPRLWVFSPEVELDAIGRTPSRALAALAADLAPAFGLLGSDDDLLLTSRAPSPAFVAALAAAGLPAPRAVPTVAEARRHRPDAVLTWGPSARLHRQLAAVEPRIPFPSADPTRDPRRLLHKGLVLEMRRRLAERGWLEPALVGTLATSLSEVIAEGPVVLKAPYSASGQRRRIVLGPLSSEDVRFVKLCLQSDGAVLVEPWLDRVLDLGLVLPEAGRPTLLRFFTDRKGAYQGHAVAPPLSEVEPEVARAVACGLGSDLAQMVATLAAEVRRLVPTGPCGLDLLAYRTAAGVRLHPAVEVNARYTMGHIAARLVGHLARGRVGIWRHLPRRHLPEAIALPEPEVVLEGEKRRLAGGLVFTSDPSTAEAAVSVLSVHRSVTEAEAAFGALGPRAGLFLGTPGPQTPPPCGSVSP